MIGARTFIRVVLFGLAFFMSANASAAMTLAQVNALQAQAVEGNVVTLATIAIAVFTALLSLFTAMLYCMARRQDNSLKSFERAYVFAEVGHSEPPMVTTGGTKSWELTVCFRNSGKTPAVVRKLRGYAEIKETRPDSLISHARSGNEIAAGWVIPKDSEYQMPVQAPITDAEWGEIEQLKATLYVTGKVEYDDVFGKRRTTGYCWEYQRHMGKGKFIISPNTKLNYYT
ncbi:MAG: hypothetical protein ACYDBH_22780 [Acidobacteriaceae bacterium]